MPPLTGIWKHYTAENCKFPPGWFGHHLTIGPEGRVWILLVEPKLSRRDGWTVYEGFARGVAYFESSHWTLQLNRDMGLPEYPIHHMGCDTVGNLWFSMMQLEPALFRYDGFQVTRMTAGKYGLPTEIGVVKACANDHAGGYWISMPFEGGLARYADGEWRSFSEASPGVPADNVTAMTVDGQGQMWFAASNDEYIAFCRYNGQVWQEWVRVSSRTYEVQALAVDPQGRLWAGWEQRGLWCLDPDTRKWTKYTAHNSALPDQTVGSLAVDRYGRVWAGASGGLTIFEEGQSVLWNAMLPETLEAPRILNLAETQPEAQASPYIALGYEVASDATGNIWALNGKGASVFSERQPSASHHHA